jgi:hypothetical protein
MPIIEASPGRPKQVGDLVDAVTQRLVGSYRAERNRLVTELSITSETMQLEYALAGATRGSYLSIDDEIVYVWSVDQGQRQVKIQRGMNGTTAEAHAQGAVVEVNPRFPRGVIRDSLRDEILSWPNDLFRVQTVQVPTLHNETTFDLTELEGFYSVLRVFYRRSRIGGWHELKNFEVIRGLETDEYSSGSGLRVLRGPFESVDLRVTAAMPFDTSDFSDTIELEYDVGLAPSMFDIPVIGACWRLVAARDVVRSFVEVQGDSRRAEEVPPGLNSATARSFERIREQRINEEFSRLRGMFPWRMS